jgi:hypothetical protein
MDCYVDLKSGIILKAILFELSHLLPKLPSTRIILKTITAYNTSTPFDVTVLNEGHYPECNACTFASHATFQCIIILILFVTIGF